MNKIEKAVSNFKNVFYHGGLIEEKKISKVMSKIDYVFVPGHSGLSINHAFAYEKLLWNPVLWKPVPTPRVFG